MENTANNLITLPTSMEDLQTKGIGVNRSLSSRQAQWEEEKKNFSDTVQGYSLRKPQQKEFFDFCFEPIIVGNFKQDISNYFLKIPLLAFQVPEFTFTDILIYSRLYDVAVNTKAQIDKDSFIGSNKYLGGPLGLSDKTVQRSINKFLSFEEPLLRDDTEPKDGYRRLTPLVDYFHEYDDSNFQYVRVYYGLLNHPQLSRESAFLYSYFYMKTSYFVTQKAHQGYYKFSLSDNDKIFKLSRTSLFNCVKRLNELGLIEVYEKSGFPLLIKTLFNIDDFVKANRELEKEDDLEN